MHSQRRRGFTLIELLVVVAIISLLISILLPALADAREQAKRAKCGASLSGIGRGIAACFTENNGFGPTWDDGEPGDPPGHQTYMLTWVDVLFDNDYLSEPKAGICPTDKRPDEPMERRGRGGAGAWAGGYRFVENIGRGEADKYGARTSFALNAYMHYNFPQDKHPDGARQVYAIDGWWTWFGSLNAAWLYSPRILGTPPDSLAFPNVGGSMVAWRHGKSFGADALFVDGHVTTIIPKAPTSQQDLLYRTVDTTKFFSLMPGESPIRRHSVMWPDGQPELEMENSIPQDQRPTWWRERPYWRFARGDPPVNQPARGKFLTGASDQFHPYNFPEHLSAAWKTANSAWRKFPQRSEGRR